MALGLVIAVLAACGGSGVDDTSGRAPTASITVPPGVYVSGVVTLNGSGSFANGGRTLTYAWVLASKPSGSAATIDNPSAVTPLLATDLVGNYVVTLTVNDGVQTTAVATTITAVALTPPVIQSDLVEPVSGTVQLSLSTADPGGTLSVNWTVDGATLASGDTVPWDTTTVANGSHRVAARLQFLGYYIDLSRTFQVRQTTVTFSSATVSESAGVFTALVGAQSANGIVRVDASLDGVAFGTLAARNVCLDGTGAACVTSGPNGYSFRGTVGSGAHVVVVTATDGIGNSLGTQLRFTVTDVP